MKIETHQKREFWRIFLILLMLLFPAQINGLQIQAPQQPETEVRILSPNGGELVNGTIIIRWEVLHPPNETLRFKIEYRFWEVNQWVQIVSGISGTSYPWDTQNLKENGRYELRVTLISVLPPISDQTDDLFSINNGDLPRVEVIYPNKDDIIGGTVLITWSVVNPSNYDLTFDLYYWDGNAWQLLQQGYTQESYHWDTTEKSPQGLPLYKDGSWYLVRVVCHSVKGKSEDRSDAPFTIRNEIEKFHAPTIRVVYPNGGEVLTGDVLISWMATDPDDDPLTFSISCFDGSVWTELAQNVQALNWTWNTLLYRNGTEYIIMVVVSDGTYSTVDQSDSFFVIFHQPPLIDITSPKAVNNTAALLTDMAWINWTVDNPVNYSLSYGIDLYIETSRKNTWLPIVRDLSNTSFEWNTRMFPNQIDYKLRVLAYYSTEYSEGITESDFGINNTYWEPPPSTDPEDLSPGEPPRVAIRQPNGGEVWNGIQTIQWVATDPDGDWLTYDIHIWNGTQWFTLVTGLYNTSYTWDISHLPSRPGYRVMISAFDGINYGVDFSESEFTIEGNLPILEFQHPLGGESLQGNVTISWTGFDPDRRGLVYTLEYYHNQNWTSLATNLTDTMWQWNTRTVENGKYLLRLTANNTIVTNTIELDSQFTVNNNFPPQIVLVWPNGGEPLKGVVEIRWNITDPNDSIENLNISVSYYYNDTTWLPLAIGLHTTQFQWNTSGVTDLNWTKIRVMASDGNYTVVDDSDRGFAIQNSESTAIISPPGSSQLTKFLFWSLISIVMGLGLFISFIGGVVHRKWRKRAVDERDFVRIQIKEKKKTLNKVKENIKKIRNQYPGWPGPLADIQANLQKMEDNPSILEYLELYSEVEDNQDEVLRQLETIGAQTQRILEEIIPEKAHISERKPDKRMAAIEEIVSKSNINRLIKSPKLFLNAQHLDNDLLSIATDIHQLIELLELTWEAHEIDAYLYSEENIAALIEDGHAVLTGLEKLKAKENESSRVALYAKGWRLYSGQKRLEKQKRALLTELKSLKDRLNELNHDLTAYDRKQAETQQQEEELQDLKEQKQEKEREAREQQRIKAKRRKKRSRRSG